MTSAAPIFEGPVPAPPLARPRAFDATLLAGLLVAVGAAILGVVVSGAGVRYFLQPAGAAIVLGGTLGILFVTTPGRAVGHSLQRIRELFSTPLIDRRALIDEIARLSRISRLRGLAEIEQHLPSVSDPFLRDGLLMSLDVNARDDLRAALETEIRLRERQAEADAKTLEVAGGFAPTLGILGTVIGLIEVLRNFTDLQSVPVGIGTAFVSTIYGLGLANLLLLPLAHRIRARAAEMFEVQELMTEGVLLIAEGVHPSLVNLRLAPFVRPGHAKK